MWRLAILTLPLLLAGCDLLDTAPWSNSEFPPDTPAPSAPAPIAPAPIAPAPSAPARLVSGRQGLPISSPDCNEVADQRARDAGAAGYDEATQQDVHARVYADCTAWRSRGQGY